MEIVIAQLVKQFEDGTLTRRQLIQSLAVAAFAAAGATASGAEAPAKTAQAAQGGGFRTMNFDHLSYDVTDYRRTRDFYAGLMGMIVANDNGKDACELHFGDARGVGVRDRTMMSIQNAASARVDHLAFKIDNWDTDRVRAELERRGIKARLARGGALDTPNYVSLTVQDPDGLGVQISGIARPGDSAYPRP
jgi:catechol 2,3-dioxygenase-like lactoylglutathione lyase family enzyme